MAEGIVSVLNASIVIPSVSDARRLETTLISLLENRPSDCEIVVPHSGYYDDPYDIADEVRLIDVPAARTEVELLAVGWSMCQAPIVHTLAPGATVEAGWMDDALARFQQPEVMAVAPQSQFSDGDATYGVVADDFGMRAAGTTAHVQAPMRQAGFYRYSLLAALGGFSTRMEEYADLDIGLWLAEAGGQCEVASGSVVQLNVPNDLASVSADRIRLAKTLQLRHQEWFAARGKASSGKLGWLSRSVGSGSISTMMSALTAKADAKAALHRLPDLDDVRAVIEGRDQTFRFDPRNDRPTRPIHRSAA